LGLTRIGGKLSIVIPIILILFISSYICPNTQAQNNTSFSPKDQFLIPSSNGEISFAVNGSYSNATFENGSWAFKNLSISGSTHLQNFLVSAQNSNITILSYFSSNTTSRLLLRYTVEGNGKQIFNFGQGPINGVDWTIIKTINRQNAHFNFYNINSLNSNLPFYKQHSVAIATSAVTAIVIVLATFVAVRNRKYEKKVNSSASAINVKKSALKDAEKP
jgi:hypothetical protein